jgi:DNA-directed RNA polymerase specialized sigma24 family protein
MKDSILEFEYIAFNKLFEDYCNKHLQRDVTVFINKHSLQFITYDLEDIKSHIKVKLLQTVQSKHNSITNKSAYMYQLVQNCMKNYIMKEVDTYNKIKSYNAEFKDKIMSQNNGHTETILTYLDELSGLEIKELLQKHLNIRQTTILWLKYLNYSDKSIGKLLKISSDYVRKIYRQTEHILTTAFKQ